MFLYTEFLNLHKKIVPFPKNPKLFIQTAPVVICYCLSLCVYLWVCAQCSTCNVLFPNTADDAKKDKQYMYHYQATNQQLPSFSNKRREILKNFEKF